MGYDALWIAGGQLTRLDLVRDLVRATDRLKVATGIVPLGLYGVTDVAALHAELREEAPGRFVLGLGGPQQPRALARLDALLTELDDLGVAAADRLLAALGPRKTTVARERAAGAVTLLTTPAATAASRDVLGPGKLLVVQQMLVLDADPRAAREAAREPLSFLAGVPGYRAAWLRMGFDDQDVDHLSDRLVDAVVVHGEEQTVVDRLVAHHDAGADHVGLSVLTTPGGADAVQVARRLAGALGLGRGVRAGPGVVKLRREKEPVTRQADHPVPASQPAPEPGAAGPSRRATSDLPVRLRRTTARPAHRSPARLGGSASAGDA